MGAHWLIKTTLLLMALSVTWVTAASSKAIPTIKSGFRSKESIALTLNRLRLDPGSANCWASLFELQSCTGEVIEFFYEEKASLGPECCRAIQAIVHHCWPAMLTTLGFTSQEGDILTDYCPTYGPLSQGIPSGPVTESSSIKLSRLSASLSDPSSMGSLSSALSAVIISALFSVSSSLPEISSPC
ncbi:hypothetical protein Cgig2_005057 [Carnegiea gigantea]|uniref:Prolamin-like domain-containing protein n=1 Tax=Carnegiea gigantea TaxID=171969 RepID=A0A9Q1L1L5_9CARY|nr:hypothetical protein Cgig2_005057 [Carnegiea gigantea]